MIGFAFKALFWMAVIAVPLLGTWLASSLAAYHAGPVKVAAAAGLLLFPVLPLAWEALGSLRRARGPKADRPRVLRLGDRLILRTLSLNLLFLGVLLAAWPKLGFTALSARGDWMLEGRQGPEVEQVRAGLFQAAGGLEWLYDAARDNPYDKAREQIAKLMPGEGQLPETSGISDPVDAGDEAAWSDEALGVEEDVSDEADGDEISEDPQEPVLIPIGVKEGVSEEGADVAEAAATEAGDAVAEVSEEEGDAVADAEALEEEGSKRPSVTEAPERPAAFEHRFSHDAAWPSPAALHPLVVDMPEEVETSYESVAAYIRDREPDPFLRVKAMHDWIADRVAYDLDSLEPGQRAPQDAVTVFERRLGVCAGYANLLAAMGSVTGDEVVYVTGQSRGEDGQLDGNDHAWNAVRVDGRWYLVDVTWDRVPVGEDKRGPTRYRSDYLFTPPDIFINDHLPEESEWQLLADPLSMGEIIRKPVMASAFYAEGFRLVSPTRSQVDAQGTIEIRLENPNGRHVIADYGPRDGEEGERRHCTVMGREHLKVRCLLPEEQTYRVNLFSNEAEGGLHYYIGHFEVTNHPEG
ncbi:MAG: hypothetical protein H6741_32185 [Alphaproteobacteria bacterium]|nr:hypothetical protein [Alphaproteobacteria bacterium]